MDEMISRDKDPQSIPLTDGALQALAKTRGWVNFLGIISIIGACFAGLAILGGLIALAAQGLAGVTMIVEGAVLAIVMILFAVYWLRYAKSLKRLSTMDGPLDAALEEAFVNQRRLWTFQGVLLILVIVVELLVAAVML